MRLPLPTTKAVPVLFNSQRNSHQTTASALGKGAILRIYRVGIGFARAKKKLPGL